MQIALIVKQDHSDTGVGRYVSSLERELRAKDHEVKIVLPIVPLPGFVIGLIRKWFGWDLEAFFQNYPVWARYPQADIYHLTSQNLATLALLRHPPGKVVLTVHDIIPYQVRDNRELRVYRHKAESFFDNLAKLGMKRINRIIVDSNFTAMSINSLISESQKITIVPLGIDIFSDKNV